MPRRDPDFDFGLSAIDLDVGGSASGRSVAAGPHRDAVEHRREEVGENGFGDLSRLGGIITAVWS